MKMWSGRFRQPLDPEFEKWQRSFSYDQRLLPFELAASRAHARALEHAGVLSSEDLAEILDGLNQIARHAEDSPEFLNDPGVEDVHHFVEKKLSVIIGVTGYKLHAGRSRNEQIATDLRLFVRSTIDELQTLLAEWLEAILTRAEGRWRRCHARLHSPAARRTSAGRALAAGVCRHVSARFRPAGIVPQAGQSLPARVGRDCRSYRCTRPARDCGRTRLRRHPPPTAWTLPATATSRSSLCRRSLVISLHLSRWAEEMILFSTPAFDFVVLPEPYSTGSSAMPQKKNPDLLELVRAKAARVMGFQVALATAVKGLPLAYNKDLQETQEPLFDAADTVVAMLPLVTGWMRTVEFNFPKMQQAAQSDFMNAWAAAAYLVERGVASRQAHEAVGKAVQLCVGLGCNLQELSLADLKAIHPAFDSDLAARLELPEVLALHDVPGGTAPQRVQQAINDARQRVAALRSEEQVATR